MKNRLFEEETLLFSGLVMVIVGGSTTVSGSNYHTIYCGQWSGFNYIGISVTYSGAPSALAIDAVHVI